MAKALVVEEAEFRHAVKVAAVTGQAKERDDVRHIQAILGVQSLMAVKRMVEADPVRLGAIVARAI